MLADELEERTHTCARWVRHAGEIYVISGRVFGENRKRKACATIGHAKRMAPPSSSCCMFGSKLPLTSAFLFLGLFLGSARWIEARNDLAWNYVNLSATG